MNHFRTGMLPLVIVAGFATAAVAAGAKEWRAATVLDTESASSYTGSRTTENYDPYRRSGVRSPYPAGSTTTAHYSTTYSYVLDTGEYIYVIEANPQWRWSKVPPVTINATVKYALDGKRHIRLIGDDAKEYKLAIVKRVLKSKR